MTPLGQWLSEPQDCGAAAAPAIALGAVERQTAECGLASDTAAVADRRQAEIEIAVEQELERRLADLQLMRAAELATVRSQWIECEADRLSEQMKQALEDMETALASCVEHLLRPFLEEVVRRRACDELAKLLHTYLRSGDASSVHVSAPADLIERLRSGLGAEHSGIAFSESGDCEVTAAADTSRFETRIAEWLGAIAGEVP
jgi:hypothetical protein